jgi:hypothetical protein
MEDNQIPEDIVPLIDAIIEDPNLRSWFFTLYEMPQKVRMTVLGQMKKKMIEKEKGAEFIHLVEELNDETIFSAVVKTVKEMTESEEI